MAAGELSGREISPPPATTALGALLAHITGDADPDSYQPMNVNFGLFAPMDGKVHKKERKLALTNRGRTDLAAWMRDQNIAL
jgi:methylenetetrahydrofolate--tRNA-(uracil-5-)-methyltransferase